MAAFTSWACAVATWPAVYAAFVGVLPHPRRDGATHLLLDPLELIEKLSVLIPPPRFHLLRFHGVLAPRAQLRSAVVPGSSREAELGGGPAPGPSPPEPRSGPSSGPEGSHGRP